MPRRARALPGFQLTDAQWDALLIPVGMAFFLHSSTEGRVLALYPSPAGATESLLPLEAWTELVAANPMLAEMEPDVEALLVNRVGGQREYYLRAHRRVLPAGRPDPHALARPVGRHRGLAGDRRLLRAVAEAQRRPVAPGRRTRTTPMPDLNFQVEGAEAGALRRRAAAGLQAAHHQRPAQSEPIHAVALHCQIRIEPPRRRYAAGRAGAAARPVRRAGALEPDAAQLLWTHANIGVPPFTGSTVVDLPVPCTYDFNVAATKYFYALEDGEVPLLLLFSGTIFYEAAEGALQIAQIPWEKEATFRLPVATWQELMDCTIPTAPGSLCTGTCSTACIATNGGTGCRPGSRRWRACWTRSRRNLMRSGRKTAPAYELPRLHHHRAG